MLVFGEGWHNNHHAFPVSARHGLHRWQLDASWWVIRGLEKLRLVWNVKVPDVAQLERRRLQPQPAPESVEARPRRAAPTRPPGEAGAGGPGARVARSPCTAPGMSVYSPSTPSARARSKPRREAAGETPGMPRKRAVERAVEDAEPACRAAARATAGRGATARARAPPRPTARPPRRSATAPPIEKPSRSVRGAPTRLYRRPRVLDAPVELVPRLDPVAHLGERRGPGTPARAGRRAIRATRSTFPSTSCALAAVHADDGRRRRGRPGQPQLGAGREPGRRVRRHPATLPSDGCPAPPTSLRARHRPPRRVGGAAGEHAAGARARDRDRRRRDRDRRPRRPRRTSRPHARPRRARRLVRSVGRGARSLPRPDPADGRAEDAAAVSPVRRRRAHGSPARSRRRGRVLPARRVTGGARAPARAEDGAARRPRRLDSRRAGRMGGRVRERAGDRARDRSGARARPRDARLHGQRAGADARARGARRRRDLH